MKLTILDDYNKRNLIRIEYMFLCRRDSLSHATIRSLLSYVLVTACKKYPNNFLLCRALDRLYGAQIGVFSTEGSDTMGMVFYMDFLNPNSLGDNQYTLKDCYDIFKEIIYNPLLVDNKFDELILSQQRDELYDNFISDLEDKLYLSELKSRDRLYESNGGYIDSDGSIDYVRGITNEELVSEYHSMIENDDLIIRVYGNLNDNDKALFEPYNDRIRLNRDWPFKPLDKPLDIVEDYNGYESYLRISFYSSIFEAEKKKSLALRVLSRMLAGDATSIFFKEIREKRGLCYNISSTYLIHSSFLNIICEHDKANTKEIKSLIFKIIDDIANGDFDALLVEEAKNLLINSTIKKKDSFTDSLLRKYKRIIYDANYSIDDEIKLYRQITKEDIIEVCKALKPQIIYCFRGVLK